MAHILLTYSVNRPAIEGRLAELLGQAARLWLAQRDSEYAVATSLDEGE